MAYTRVNWENLPSTNTPVNATNLNKMDAGIKTLDDNYNAILQSNITITSDYEIGDSGCFKSQNSVIIGFNINNSNSTFPTYAWTKIAQLPSGARPSIERYFPAIAFGAGLSNPTAVPARVTANGEIFIYPTVANLKRVIANATIAI